jgi:hypothetical protein
MYCTFFHGREANMLEWKFLTSQRVRVKRSVDIPPPSDVPVRLPPPDGVLGKTGIILTRVQPVWASDVPQGEEMLHQYEVDIDEVGATLINEEWLEPAGE